MARMKFLCDVERCIECNACVTACKNENEVPWGVNRRRVVTINDGSPGERSMSVQCMQATDMERSPGEPSLMVTTRRRLTPHGTSFSFLHAVTHALHSMQRWASQRNFILAMVYVLRSSQARLMRHREHLLSCICVTES